MKTKKFRIIAVTLAVSLSCVVVLFGQGEPTTNDSGDTTLVAIVNTKPIPYSAIKVTSEAATNRFVFENERGPETEADLLQVEQIRRTSEVNQLAKYIRWTIREQQISRLGIENTDAELKQRWERLLRDGDSPATKAAMHDKLMTLLDCLRAVHEESENADEVYNTRLADKFPRDYWNSALRQYRTPEHFRLLEDMINDDGEFDEDAKDTANRLLVMEKLQKAIEKDLIRTDPEFGEYIRMAKTDPGNEKVQSKGRNYRLVKRNEWWQQRYREAKIEILDERFEGALGQMFQVGSK